MSYTVYYPDGCGSIPDHIAIDFCSEDIEHGRVRSVGFVHKNTLASLLVDPSDPDPYIAAIELKTLIVIPEVIGAFDGGSPIEAPGYGNLETRTTGYNFTLTFKDPGYKQNAAFYNALKFSRDWIPIWVTETQVHLAAVPARVIPKNPITEDLNSEVVWDVEVRFTQPDVPAPFDIPPGVFEVFAYTP